MTWPTESPSMKTSTATQPRPSSPPTEISPTDHPDKQPSEWTPLAIVLFCFIMGALCVLAFFFGKKIIQNRRMQRRGSEFPLMGYSNFGATVDSTV